MYTSESRVHSWSIPDDIQMAVKSKEKAEKLFNNQSVTNQISLLNVFITEKTGPYFLMIHISILFFALTAKTQFSDTSPSHVIAVLKRKCYEVIQRQVMKMVEIPRR